jgi:hypothetical protein
MKNTENTNPNFIVAIDQINNSKALLPFILFNKMELYAQHAAVPFKDHIISKPVITKLNIFKNAFLNDQLILESHIKKLSHNELELIIEVVKKNKVDIICNAVFWFSLDNFQINIAS